MAQKFNLVEFDGYFGLIAKNPKEETTQNLRKYSIRLDEDGQIKSLSDHAWNFYEEYFISKNDVPLKREGEYIPKGSVHYLGKRMSLEKFEKTLPLEFEKIFEKFKNQHPQMESNYKKPFSQKAEAFFAAVFNGYKKIEQFNEKMQEESLNALDAQLPGFKAGIDYMTQKVEMTLDSIEEKIIEELDRQDDIELAKMSEKKPPLASSIAAASAKAKQINALSQPNRNIPAKNPKDLFR